MVFYAIINSMIASPMRRLIDELSFSARVVVIILIAVTTLFVIALDEPVVITALVEMARAFAP
jgi:hypothetical protein